MKTALLENGDSIAARADAPATAVCPHCGCSVTLRTRSLMGGGTSYFWRHTDNGRVPCARRVRPYTNS